MATYEVDVGGETYEVDAPDENTAWKWANQFHSQGQSKEVVPVTPEPQNESLADVAKNVGLGIASGAANIGNTLINAATFLPRKLASAVGNEELGTWNREREASLRDFQQEAKSKGRLPFSAGELTSEIAGTSGVGNLLKIPALGANMPRLAKALETGGFSALEGGSKTANALMRLAAGGAVGGASAGLINPEDAGTGALVGAGTVGVGVPLIKGATLGAGKLYDLVSGNLPKVSAGRIARDVAGPEIEAIRKANLVADDALTSAQATADVPRFEWQALGEKARAGDPTAYGLKADAQEAKRLKALDSVMPDLEEAIKTRDVVAGKKYEAAFNLDKQQVEDAKRIAQLREGTKTGGIRGFTPPKRLAVGGELLKLKENPIISSAAKEAKILAESQGVDIGNDPMETLLGMHYMKLAIDNQFKNRTAPTALQNYSDAALTGTKEKLLGVMEDRSPMYKQARRMYSKLSTPINQAKLIQTMKDTLVNTRGGERVTPFLNAMGPGEKSLFRKADQSPRFGSLDEVLSPQQRQVKDRIVRELKRDAEVSRRVKEASSKTSDIIAGDSVKIRLPSLIDRWLSATKQGIDVAGEQINKKTMLALVEGMKTGKSANEMLATLPVTERNKVLKALIEMPQGGTIPAGLGALSAEGE